MRLGAGQAGTELTFFAGLCATRGATNRQGQFLFGFHASQCTLVRNKMVNSDQFLGPASVNTYNREIPTSAGVVLWAIRYLAFQVIRFFIEVRTLCRYRTP